MFWGILIGLAVGTFFHKQIAGLTKKTVKLIKNRKNKSDSYWDED